VKRALPASSHDPPSIDSNDCSLPITLSPSSVLPTTERLKNPSRSVVKVTGAPSMVAVAVPRIIM
jgi:hypothetical protein